MSISTNNSHILVRLVRASSHELYSFDDPRQRPIINSDWSCDGRDDVSKELCVCVCVSLHLEDTSIFQKVWGAGKFSSTHKVTDIRTARRSFDLVSSFCLLQCDLLTSDSLSYVFYFMFFIVFGYNNTSKEHFHTIRIWWYI